MGPSARGWLRVEAVAPAYALLGGCAARILQKELVPQ